jgi:ribulose-5-phosphate 4-epimerase/fuculose-1-phosphate aldolase
MNEIKAASLGISAEEMELRRELAACYRIFADLGWVELIYNHITVRVPGADDHFLINPYGLMYTEVTASNLVKIDVEGRIIGSQRYPVNPAGFVVHSALHANVPEAKCIMHTHTTAGLAVACKKDGLSFNNFYSAILIGDVAYHPFEGITVHPEEMTRLLKNIGDKRHVILRNHGLLTWGSTIPEAFVRMWTLNRACEIQLATGSIAGEDIELTDEVRDRSARDAFHNKKDMGTGRDVFEALRRKIDALDPSYRN